jgi:hypothetical protein
VYVFNFNFFFFSSFQVAEPDFSCSEITTSWPMCHSSLAIVSMPISSASVNVQVKAMFVGVLAVAPAVLTPPRVPTIAVLP